MPRGVADADAQVFINGRRLATGEEGDDPREPTALSGLSITWGRDTTVDQPGTSSCTFEVLTQGARGSARPVRYNYVLDPRAQSSNTPITGWVPMDGTTSTGASPVPFYAPGRAPWSASYGRFYANGASPRMTYTPPRDTGIRVSAGGWVSGSVYVLGMGSTINRLARATLVLLDGTGAEVGRYVGPRAVVRGDEWRRLEVNALYLGGAEVRSFRLEFAVADPDGSTQDPGAANALYYTAAQVEPAEDAYGYFDGTYAPSASSTYSWSGTVNNAVSVAQPINPWLFTGAVVDVTSKGSRWWNPWQNYATDSGFEVTSDGTSRVRVFGSTSQSAVIVTGQAGAEVHAGSRAIRVTPTETAAPGRLRAIITPAPYSTTPDAWSALPTTGSDPVNETWRVGVWLRLPAGTRFTLYMFASSTPDLASGSTFAGTDYTHERTGWAYYETTGSPQNPTYQGFYIMPQVTIVNAWWAPTDSMTWEAFLPATRWATYSGYTWADARFSVETRTLTVDDVAVYPPERTATEVYAYTGRVTSLVESWDDTLDAPVTKVTCHDFTAELANTDVGDLPWPQEGWRTRYGKVMSASGMAASVRVVYPGSSLPDSTQVKARDVDASPALGLLEELVTSVDGVQWSATDRATGPYLLIEDPSLRRTQDQVFRTTPLPGTRTNRAWNTRALSTGGQYNSQPGTGQTDSRTFLTGRTDGPLLADGSVLDSYYRVTVSGTKTGGASGPYYRTITGEIGTQPSGFTYVLSMWVRPSVTVSLLPAGQVRSAGTTVGNGNGPTTVCPAGVWTRISATITNAPVHDQVQFWAALQAADALPSGGTIDIAGPLFETNATEVGDFLDGDMTSRDAFTAYRWTGARSASRSTLTHYTLTAGVLELDACQVLREPVEWTQDTQDVSTRVSVTWYDPVAATDKLAQVVDTAAEAKYGKRRVSISSQLVTEASALNVANRVLNRVRVLDWRAQTLSLDASVINNDDSTPGAFAEVWLALLNGTRRNGLLLALTNLPDWAPVATNAVAVYVEGGKYVHERGVWVLELTVSNALDPNAVVTAAAAPATALAARAVADEGEAGEPPSLDGLGPAEARTELTTITRGAD